MGLVESWRYRCHFYYSVCKREKFVMMREVLWWCLLCDFGRAIYRSNNELHVIRNKNFYPTSFLSLIYKLRVSRNFFCSIMFSNTDLVELIIRFNYDFCRTSIQLAILSVINFAWSAERHCRGKHDMAQLAYMLTSNYKK